MKNNKSSLILWIILMVVSSVVFTLLILLGIDLGNDDLVVYSALIAIILVPVFIWKIISSILKKSDKKSNNYQDFNRENEKNLIKQYNSMNIDEVKETGYVSFLNSKLKFSAEGKFGYIKDFKGKHGYHLAFSIDGTKLVGKPKDYEDEIGFEDVLFNIEIGYFEGVLLSDFENDNGIIVKDINNLEGKKIKIKQDAGYMATIREAEFDDIDYGEITFLKWNDEEKIIQFKLLVSVGLNDIVFGTVNLQNDTNN